MAFGNLPDVNKWWETGWEVWKPPSRDSLLLNRGGRSRSDLVRSRPIGDVGLKAKDRLLHHIGSFFAPCYPFPVSLGRIQRADLRTSQNDTWVSFLLHASNSASDSHLAFGRSCWSHHGVPRTHRNLQRRPPPGPGTPSTEMKI